MRRAKYLLLNQNYFIDNRRWMSVLEQTFPFLESKMHVAHRKKWNKKNKNPEFRTVRQIGRKYT